jgi:class 3 adenylate cyclase/tetratricopeptide (TPR) repeat protein
MLSYTPRGVDDLLDRAGDAIARNDWALAHQFAQEVLRQVPQNAEAALILRTAKAYLETDQPVDPFSSSRDLRFMSIMFCDVVGSRDLALELGDVQWRSTLDRFRRRCARAVRRYDGYIHEASGDELLVLFGYPRVREDDARRAVLAGFDIVAAVQAFSALLEAEYGFPFHARVGIHTGKAFIGDRTRSGPREGAASEIGDGLVGDAANVAKRIESAARPDTVWVSRTTRHIVEGFFEFADAPEDTKQLDVGSRAPVVAYEVKGRTAALNRHQIARVRADEMIGRDAELEQLLHLWEQAKDEGAPLVVVSGHAGIGKSRLVEFLAETAAASRANRVECICTELSKPVAFAPLVGLIERFANIRQTDDPETRFTKLYTAFRDVNPAFEQYIPYVAWMMSIPRPGYTDVGELEPEAARTQVFSILIELLTLVASTRPTVFWIEDVQWADHSTREFCRRLESHGPIRGLMVVATMRTVYEEPDAERPWFDGMPSTRALVRIRLEPLSPAESRQLIASRSAAPIDEHLAEVILESTGGNPLYIEEVVRSVAAGGAARKADGLDGPSIALPETLQPIFAQIVERLRDDRKIAQIASLLGRELPEPMTRTVIAAILGVSDRDVVAGLERLIEAEVIEPVLTELSRGYRFRHALIREALAHSVGPDAKRNHHRIASVVEQSFPEMANDRPELLAYHFAKADQHQQAAEYCLKAGLRLQAKAAHEEAIAFFTQGLDSLSRLSGPAVTECARLELALRASRGVSVQTTKGYTHSQAGHDWSRAHELSKQTGATTDIVPALGGLWSFYFVRGAHTFVRELNATGVGVAQRILDVAGDDSEARIVGYTCLAWTQYFSGALMAGRECAERTWQLRESNRDRPSDFPIPQDPALAAFSLLGPVRWSLGDQRGGLRAGDEAFAIALALENKRAINLARVGQTNAWLHQIRRDYTSACRAADQVIAVARDFHIDWAVVNLSIHRALAVARLAEGDAQRAEALAAARQNIAYWRASGAETMVPYFLGELAEACRVGGDVHAALLLVDEAIALGQSNDEHFHDAELYRIRGETRLVNPDQHVNALEDLVNAVSIARRQRAVSFEIRALVALLGLQNLSDRHVWLARLETALHELQSSEYGEDERRARELITRASEPARARGSEPWREESI